MTTLRSGSATDIGKVRTTNQDVALEDPGLFAVADGMGGHVGGEVAARVAVDSLRAAFRHEPTVEGLRRAVAEANRAVWRQGQSEIGLRGMGTTLTASALVEEAGGRQVIALANVGDSRAYVYSRGQVIQVTADHSLAEERVRQGQLTEAEAAVHPHRHVLTRALGVSSDVDVDLWELHLHDGDRILLCSDGLTNEIGDERISEILGTVKDPSEAAKTLVDAALDHGGSDNVTCVVIDVAESPAAPAAAGADAPGVLGAGPAHSGEAPTPAAEGGRGGEGAAFAATTARERTSNGARASAPVRMLRAVGGTGMRPPARPGIKVGGARNANGTIAVVESGNRAGEAGAAGAGGLIPGAGGPTNGVAGEGSGNALASTRLHAAELRRLRPARDDRHRRRRAAGAQRLVTVRLVLFFVLLLAVVAAAYAALRWYATDEWYVGIDHGHLAVYQGRPGGLLWFKPRLVDETSVTTHEVPPYEIPQLRADHVEDSLAAAKGYVRNLQSLGPRSRSTGSTRSAQPGHGSAPGDAGRKSSTSTTKSAFSATLAAWQ